MTRRLYETPCFFSSFRDTTKDDKFHNSISDAKLKTILFLAEIANRCDLHIVESSAIFFSFEKKARYHAAGFLFYM